MVCVRVCICVCARVHISMCICLYSHWFSCCCCVQNFVHNAAFHTSFVSVCVCVCVHGCHGAGPHYLVGSHTDMATARWGQLADLFLFPQLFNELVMGRTAQLPRQLGWTLTPEVGNLYILGSQAYANGPLVLFYPLFFCQNVLLVPSWTWHVC